MLVKLAGGALSGLISAREKYNKSKSLKSTVEKVISGISKGIEVTKSFIKEKGGTVKDKLDKAKKSKNAKKTFSLFAKARNATKRSIEKVKTAVGIGKDVKADELEDEKGDKTSSKDPPLEEIDEITKEEVKELARLKDLEVKDKKNKDEDGLEGEDGEPTEKGYLKILTEAVLGEEGMLGKTKGWFGRGKARMGEWMQNRRERAEARRKEVEEEKKAVQERMKAKNKKKGGSFLSKLLKGGLIGLLATMLITPIKLLAKPFMWLGSKILKGLGKLVWWGTKKIVGGLAKVGWGLVKGITKGIVKGVWWIIKKFAGGLGKALKWFGRGIFNMSPKWAQRMFTTMGKWASSIGRGFSTLGNVFKSGLSTLGSKMSGWFSNLGSIIKNIKPGSIAKSVWEGTKSFFGKGGWARTALTTVGRVAVQVGGRILAGVVAVGPIGWVIGIGLALWGAYELYKYFKNGKGKFPDTSAGRISQLRMYSYGLDSDNNDKFKKMFELEEIIGRFLKRKDDGGIEMNDIDIQAQTDIVKTLGLNGEEPGPREEATSEWLYGRFIPAYIEFMRVLWNQKEDVKAGELDKLTQKELASLIYDYDPPGEIWDIEYLPFTDISESTMTREFFDEFHNSIKNELANEWDGIQTKRMNDEDREIKNKNLTSRDRSKNRDRLKDGINRKNEQTKASNWITKHSSELEKKYKERSYTSTYGPNGEINIGSHEGITLNGIRNGSMLGLSMRKDIPTYTGPIYNYDIGEANARRISPEEMGSMSLDRVFSLTAEMTGIPEEILWTVAKLEAGLDPLAKSSTSSASGLFQMINSTWETMVQRYGKKYGITPQNANRWIPIQNALMGAEYMRENLANIRGYEKIGLDLATALYFAHFFGGAGVKRFMALYARNPDLPMKQAVSDKVYRANSVVMRGVTMRQFVDMYRARFNDAMNTPATAFKGYLNHRKAFPQLYENSVPNDKPRDGKKMEDIISPGIDRDPKSDEGGGSLLLPGIAGQLGVFDRKESGTSGNTMIPMGAASQIAGISDQSKNFTNNGLPSWNDSNDWGSNIADQIASNYQGDNVGIEMLRSMGLIHKDSKYYLNDDGTYGPKGASNSYGGGFADYSYIGASDPGSYTGPRQVLTSDYANPDADAVKVHPILAGHPFYFTSLYGPRDTNIENASKVHGGVDIGTPTKTAGVPIVASGDGTVMRSYRSTTYGEVVYLRHPDGLQTRYAHLSKRLVREGQEVRAGQLLGLMGNTGTGSGVHLHYEVRKGHGQKSPTINPMNFNIIKNSYKGLYVPTVIDPKGKVESDEELSDENFQRKQLEALGIPEGTGLEGLEESQKSLLMVDPVTGLTKEDQEKLFKDRDDLQMKNFDGQNFEGYFIEDSEDGKLKLTREDNGRPFNYHEWYRKNKSTWEQLFNMKEIGEEAKQAALKADELYNKNISDRRKAYVEQIGDINDSSSLLHQGLTGKLRPEDEVRMITKDDVKDNLKVDVDLDLDTKSLEDRLIENNNALVLLTKTIQEFVKINASQLKPEERSKMMSESNTKVNHETRVFGGESIRSKQRVVF